MTDTDASAVIVAAGRSERMGRPKLALPLGDTTLLAWTVRAALDSRCSKVVVVAGAGTPSLPETPRLVVTHNPDPDRGNASSLMCGIAAAPAGHSIVVIPGDQPEISSDTIDRLIAASAESGAWALVAHYDDGMGHPLLLSPAAVASLDDLEGVKPLWRHVVERPPYPTERVEAAGARPTDVNTPNEYRTVLRRLGLDPRFARSVP